MQTSTLPVGRALRTWLGLGVPRVRRVLVSAGRRRHRRSLSSICNGVCVCDTTCMHEHISRMRAYMQSGHDVGRRASLSLGCRGFLWGLANLRSRSISTCPSSHIGRCRHGSTLWRGGGSALRLAARARNSDQHTVFRAELVLIAKVAQLQGGLRGSVEGIVLGILTDCT